jgi:HKD family nuclease
MKVSFHAQPFLDFGGWTVTRLEEQLNKPEIVYLQMAVAWVKRSGLARLESAILGYRSRGGRSSVIIGIDEGGATLQGLHLAVDLFDEVFIFHDPSSRTYHPKVYVASGDVTAALLVGSNNMTAGGLFSNYEAAIRCDLELTDEEDRRLLDQMISWFELLRSKEEVCKRLTPELLSTLISDRRYLVGDEDRPRREKRNLEGMRDGITVDAPGNSIFSVPASLRSQMARIPVSPRRLVVAPRKARKRPTPSVKSQQQPIPTPRGRPAPRVVWWKKMSKSDAQHPTDPNTKRTGNLKLTQSGRDIDLETYFRNQMFGNLVWTREQTSRGVKETTEVTFDVLIDGRALDGQYTLKIDHALE